MSYIFIFKSFKGDATFNCLNCHGKFVKIVKISVSHRSNAGKDISSYFCEGCFRNLFGYDNERKQLKEGIYREKDDILDIVYNLNRKELRIE